MKLLLAFAFLAVALAAEIRVQPLVLPEAPQPEVYEAPEVQQLYSVQFVDFAPADSEVDAVKLVDAAPVDSEAQQVDAVKLVDAAPVHIEAQQVDAVKLVDEAPVEAEAQEVNAVKFVDTAPDDAEAQEVDAVKFVDVVPVDAEAQQVDAVKFVDTVDGEDMYAVNFVDAWDVDEDEDYAEYVDENGPLFFMDEAFYVVPNAQVDPIVVDMVEREMPLEYLRNPMLRN